MGKNLPTFCLNQKRYNSYFQKAERKWDIRMDEAITVILKKRNKDGTWNMQAAHPGKLHFIMEKAGTPSRWNTLRAMRVLKNFKSNLPIFIF